MCPKNEFSSLKLWVLNSPNADSLDALKGEAGGDFFGDTESELKALLLKCSLVEEPKDDTESIESELNGLGVLDKNYASGVGYCSRQQAVFFPKRSDTVLRFDQGGPANALYLFLMSCLDLFRRNQNIVHIVEDTLKTRHDLILMNKLVSMADKVTEVISGLTEAQKENPQIEETYVHHILKDTASELYYLASARLGGVKLPV